MRIEKRKAPAEIFTGSILDMAFLLIICFMLATAFSVTRGIDLALPEHAPSLGKVAGEGPIVVQVKADGSFAVDGRVMTLDGFAGYLKTKVDPGSDPPAISKTVILRPEADAPYGAMMAAFDELRQARGRLNLARDLNVFLPTQREIEAVWGALGALNP
jgi:biopolymer transport protein ExbD